MIQLTAAQHFFGNVPADQSPTHRRGYQTLFYTSGLSKDIVKAIEDRAQYYTVLGDPVKRQFYPLPGGYSAVSQTVSLAEPDEFGRRGRYLTHTLVLSAPTLEQLDGCPLDIFHQFPFARTLEECFRQYPSPTNAPTIDLRLTSEWIQLAAQNLRDWSAEQLQQLGRFTWQAARLLTQRASVRLIGSEEDQLATLRILFGLAAPQQRAQLSFDTQATGCDWGREIVFWLQGYVTAETRAPQMIEVAGHRIHTTLVANQDGPFARWMTAQLTSIPNTWVNIQHQSKLVSAIERVLFENGALTGTSLIPANLCEWFAQHNAQAVVNRWVTLLPAKLSPNLVQIITVEILHNPACYLQDLLEGIEPADIEALVYKNLLLLRDIPTNKNDQKILGKWITESSHLGLQALLAFWQRDRKKLYKILNELSATMYENLLQCLRRWPNPPLPMWEFLVGSHYDLWFSIAGKDIPPKDWREILPVLNKLGEPAWECLANITLQLSPASQEEIKSWFKNDPDRAPSVLRNVLRWPAKSARRGLLG